jgi:hypothetical protein
MDQHGRSSPYRTRSTAAPLRIIPIRMKRQASACSAATRDGPASGPRRSRAPASFAIFSVLPTRSSPCPPSRAGASDFERGFLSCPGCARSRADLADRRREGISVSQRPAAEGSRRQRLRLRNIQRHARHAGRLSPNVRATMDLDEAARWALESVSDVTVILSQAASCESCGTRPYHSAIL